jgi:chromosome partitioning protein
MQTVARVLAIANQKGGVAKTTTAHALGYALTELGRRVLLVDLDPQACLTFSVGLNPDGIDRSLHDVFVRKMKVADARRPVDAIEGLDIVPSTIDLAGSEVHLLTRTAREHVLARALQPVAEEYDFIVIDCPPSLGILTINGLTAAAEVLIPLQCEALSHRGVGQLLETVEDVKMFANADLRVRGVVATMFDGRTLHGRSVLDDMGKRYGLDVIGPPVRKSIRFAEAPGMSRCILQHAPTSQGAEAYRAIARIVDSGFTITGDDLTHTEAVDQEIAPAGDEEMLDDSAAAPDVSETRPPYRHMQGEHAPVGQSTETVAGP